MPRKPRLDIEGALHHIIVRGINRQIIFKNNRDRADFVERLAVISQEAKTNVYAWVLIPNHFHLLIRSGPKGLPAFMRRLLTGYAISFNKRHDRSGHLFQNRYKSILCEQEPYFLELLRYIHLNPLRAGIVKSVDELDRYTWSGHRPLLGNSDNNWQDISAVLLFFGNESVKAIEGYRDFINVGAGDGHRPELSGIRAQKTLAGDGQQFDERILGSPGFTADIVGSSKENDWVSVTANQQEMKRIIEEYCSRNRISIGALTGGSRAGSLPKLRSILVCLLAEKLSVPYAEIGRKLGIGTARVSKIIAAKDKAG